MSSRFMFHTLVALIAVLTYSVPFTTLAQEQAVQYGTPETDAEQDASVTIDVSQKFRWFSVGVSTGIAGICLGGLGGFVIGDSIGPSDPGLLVGGGTSADVGFVVGAAAGVAVPILVNNYLPVRVPRERLIGKPPDYVESYTDAYKTKIRSVRQKWGTTGIIIGAALPVIGILALHVMPPD